MLEWEVVGDEAEAPSAPPASTQRRGWRVALSVLLAAALLFGAVRWQQQRRLDEVRRALTTLIADETRVQAMGEWRQAIPFADPDAPSLWRNAYLFHIAHPPSNPTTPTLTELSLNDAGDRAEVLVEWSNAGQRASREPRAYRWRNGVWHRTPLRPEAVALVERSLAHFELRGEPALLDELADPRWHFDPDALYASLATRWPTDWLERRPLTLVIRWQEFLPAVQKTASRRLLLVNAPTLNYQSGGALSSEAYYRLQLTDQLILKIVPVQQRDDTAYAALQRQLQWAEARWWALDADERALLQAEWRRALGSADPWQLATQPIRDEATDAQRQAQWRAMNLLLDSLVEAQGVALLGRLAQGLATLDADTLDGAAIEQWLSEGSALSREALQQRLAASVRGE